MQFKLFLAALILFGMVSILPISAEESSGDGYRIASAKHVKVYAESWSVRWLARESWPDDGFLKWTLARKNRGIIVVRPWRIDGVS